MGNRIAVKVQCEGSEMLPGGCRTCHSTLPAHPSLVLCPPAAPGSVLLEFRGLHENQSGSSVYALLTLPLFCH